MRTPLPPVPLQITRTMLNGGGSDVIRQCCCWSERRHQSSPSVPVVNLYHSSVTSLESQTNVTSVLMWPFDVHRGCFTERIHASQNKVTSNRTRCNQSCVTETNRFGLQLSCLWLGYLDEMSLLLLSYLDMLITGSKATWKCQIHFHPVFTLGKSHTHPHVGHFPTTACVTVIMSAQMGPPTLSLRLWWRRICHNSSAILSL